MVPAVVTAPTVVTVPAMVTVPAVVTVPATTAWAEAAVGKAAMPIAIAATSAIVKLRNMDFLLGSDALQQSHKHEHVEMNVT